MNRNVIVISGLTLSGKSWFLEKLVCLADYSKSTVVRMDDIRKKFWGEKFLTNAEGVYRNELTRNEIKRALIIDGAETVLVEMPMLTRQNHQRPFVEMVADTEKYVQAIEKEKAEKEDKVIECPSRVNLRVVLAYCSPKTAFVRVARRRNEPNATNTIVFGEDQYLSIATRFELPDSSTYIPLPVDTSDESTDNVENMLHEIQAFMNDKPLSQKLVEERLNIAQGYLDEAREEATRRGITKLLV